MAIAMLQQSLIRTLICFSVIALVACGGGGGSKPKDKTPEAFSFTASTNAAPSAVVTSVPITISGIDAASPITITGGQYSVAGGAFTTAAGTIKNNQSLSIRVTASATTNAEVQAVVTIGGVSGTFRVTTAPDVTPNSFTLGSATGVALSSINTSNAITLSGIDAAVPISITGGQYAINGSSYTTTAGTISSGQSVTVRLAAAATNSTSVEAVLTIGGVSATYTVVTISDTTPNAFSFPADTDVEPNSENISDAITVMGIDAATPISITNGEYSINGGAYVSAAANVTVGQTVTVKVIAPNGTDLTQTAVLTIGGVTGNYAVTTFPDDEAPVAEFKFPTPYTMSEADSVKVRGTATDYNAITSVKVKVNTAEAFEVTPIAEGDYSSWTADIPLTADSDNTVVVLTEDEKGNVADSAAQVVIRQAVVTTAFPNAINEFDSPSGGIVYDNYGDRNRLLVSDVSMNAIVAIDLESGNREIYKDLDALNIEDLWGMVIDDSGNEPVLYALEYEVGNIHKMSLSDGEILESYSSGLYREPRTLIMDEISGVKQLVSVNTQIFDDGNSDVISYLIPEDEFSVISPSTNEPFLFRPWGLVADEARNRYLISAGNQDVDANKHGIFSVNRTNGEHDIFSTNTTGSGESFSAALSNGTAFLREIVINPVTDQLIVPESISNKLFSIDLDSGNRSVIADLTYVDVTATNSRLFNLYLDSNNQYLVITELSQKAILLVDLQTGQKVILSKSTSDN